MSKKSVKPWGKAGSKKEPEHKTHTTKQSQSQSGRD